MKIAWFSAGITSAVAVRIAIENYSDVEIYYIETGSHHSDNLRFLNDCEIWYNKKINIIQSKKYSSVIDLILTSGFVNSPNGAPCTKHLKTIVRQDLHNRLNPEFHVMGYEYDKKEILRYNNLKERYPTIKFIAPLIDFKLNKSECFGIVESAKIKIPEMYSLGYDHNNCVGCVKGGVGYWNKIKIDFPDIFDEMAKTERIVGNSCINGVFLDELHKRKGRKPKKIASGCGLFCQNDFGNLNISKK